MDSSLHEQEINTESEQQVEEKINLLDSTVLEDEKIVEVEQQVNDTLNQFDHIVPEDENIAEPEQHVDDDTYSSNNPSTTGFTCHTSIRFYICRNPVDVKRYTDNLAKHVFQQ